VFKKSFANLLDKSIAAGQSGQTIGVPIGPDTSRIVAELIATEIENDLHSKIPDLDRRAVRYVDDMYLGVGDNENPDSILSLLSSSMYEFELELNAEKTLILGVGASHNPEWVHYVRNFQVSRSGRIQRDDLDSYFEQAMYLSEKNPRDNVLRYAVLRASSFEILEHNERHLIRWMIYCCRRAGSCMDVVTQFAAQKHLHGSSLPLDEIREFILSQLPLQAQAAHTFEVAWLLFFARELKILIPAAALAQVCKLQSSVCGLLTMDLRQRKLVDGNLDDSYWSGAAEQKGLRSPLWLIAYEATRKQWWSTSVKSAFITTDQYFGELWQRGVYFYDERKKSRSVREQRQFAPKLVQVRRRAAPVYLERYEYRSH
jgi:hypothetical protein